VKARGTRSQRSQRIKAAQFLRKTELLRLAKQSSVSVVACVVLTSCGIGCTVRRPDRNHLLRRPPIGSCL
jgi:hypothetical protein